MLFAAESIFPHLNASLNFLATVLLVLGLILIKLRKETAHKWVMIGCFGVSVVFLACYLFHKIVVVQGVGTPFPKYPGDAIRYTYYAILLTHVLLAMAVPVLAIMTIRYGLRDDRPRHLRWAKITFPIWLYVSITGVVVYWMLYRLYPPRADEVTIPPVAVNTVTQFSP